MRARRRHGDIAMKFPVGVGCGVGWCTHCGVKRVLNNPKHIRRVADGRYWCSECGQRVRVSPRYARQKGDVDRY